MGYTKELLKASLIKAFANLLPTKGKYRIIKFLYNYQSSKIRGIDICTPYLKEYAFIFLVNTKDIIGWKIFFFGEYEESTNQLLRKFIKPGDIVVEAGANNGSETLLLSKLVENGKVYAFEPIPHVFNRLKFNVDINQLNDNVHLSEVALGEENKLVEFYIFPRNYANQGMSSKYGKNNLTSRLEVQQITLDSWVQKHNISKLDFLKMDIQGAEIDLLKGGLNSIAKFQPIIFTEAADAWLNTLTLYNLLIQLNYKIYLIQERKFVLIKSATEIKSGNWLAVPTSSNLTL